MSKSILVIDTPERCSICKFLERTDEDYCYCGILEFDYQVNEYMKSTPKGKPDWCPLKAVPSKKKEIKYLTRPDRRGGTETYGETRNREAVGWNDCIDEILKGGEWEWAENIFIRQDV